MVVKQEDPAAERAWVHIVVSALGAVVTAAVLVALYYLLPLDDLSGASAVTGLVVGIVVFVALIAWQVWRILRSDHPGSRALEGLFVAVPLFILLFATAYYLMARAEPKAFTEALSRTDALYLTVTIFSTVGFGDISPEDRDRPARGRRTDDPRPDRPGRGDQDHPRRRATQQGALGGSG